MTCSFIRLATLQFEAKLQKSIRMGINIFKIFIWGGISSDVRLEIAVKLNFRPNIWRYTSPNENFEYIYPLSDLQTLGKSYEMTLSGPLADSHEIKGFL